MSTVTTNMGLTAWDSTSDLFNHTELANNWDLVDEHDHTSGKGVQVGVGGIANSAVTGATIASNAVTAAKIQDGTITAAKLSALLADTALASPNNSAYRTLLMAQSPITRDASAGTYILGTSYGDTGGFLLPALNGTNLAYAPTASQESVSLPSLIYFDDADYTVGGKTQKLRLRAQVLCNATAPAINFTVGLYPVTVAGAADNLTFTLGTVVTGSTVALNTPSASTVNQGNSGDFTIPADGPYALGFVSSGTLANNAACFVYGHLQTRHT